MERFISGVCNISLELCYVWIYYYHYTVQEHSCAYTASGANSIVLTFSFKQTQSASVIVYIYLLYINVCMSLCFVCCKRVQWPYFQLYVSTVLFVFKCICDSMKKDDYQHLVKSFRTADRVVK